MFKTAFSIYKLPFGWYSPSPSTQQGVACGATATSEGLQFSANTTTRGDFFGNKMGMQW